MNAEAKRRTGRTTRLLDDAIGALLGSDNVLIIGANRVHTNYLRRTLAERADSIGFDVRALPEQRIVVATEREAQFDWTGMYSALYPGYITFVDHYTVESRWAALLLAWTRYDDEPWVQPPPMKNILPPAGERRLILKKRGDTTS